MNETLAVLCFSDHKVCNICPFSEYADCEQRLVDSLKASLATESSKEQSLDKRLARYLIYLGMPVSLRGFELVISAVKLAVEQSNAGITKVIYPKLAEQFGTYASRVERAIRHAIEATWNRGDMDVLQHVFGNTIDPDRGKPTNIMFIRTIAKHVELGDI